MKDLSRNELEREVECLRASELRYRCMVEASPSSILVVQDGVIVFANPVASRRLGFDPPDDVLGIAVLDIIAEAQHGEVRRRLDSVAAGETTAPAEIEIVTLAGERLQIDTRWAPTTWDGRPSVLVIGRDVTEQRDAERSRQELFQSLEKAQAFAHVGSWSWDLAAETVFWSTEMYLIYGRRVEDGPPTIDEYLEHIHPDDRPALESAIERSLETGIYEVEYRLFRYDDGSERAVRASGKVEFDAAGTPIRHSGAAIDITDRRRAEEALRSLAVELSVVEERKRREFATFLHDHIGQTLAVLRMRFGDVSKRLGASELGDRVESMRDLLERAIDETQSLTFELSPPVLYDLGLEPALEWLGEKICSEHDLAFEFTDDGRHKPLGPDIAPLLFRSVRELLYNVVKHADASAVELSVTQATDRVRVTLRDNGVGFDPGTLAPTVESTHFGLFSVRERLAAIGGRMAIDSAPARGTRVTLEAPVATDASPETEKRP